MNLELSSLKPISAVAASNASSTSHERPSYKFSALRINGKSANCNKYRLIISTRRSRNKLWTTRLYPFQYNDKRYAEADGNRIMDFLAAEGNSLRNLTKFEPRNQYDYDSTRRSPLPKKLVKDGSVAIVNADLDFHGIVKEKVERMLRINYKEECNKKVRHDVNSTLIPFSQFRQEYIEKRTPWKKREILFTLLSAQGLSDSEVRAAQNAIFHLGNRVIELQSRLESRSNSVKSLSLHLMHGTTYKLLLKPKLEQNDVYNSKTGEFEFNISDNDKVVLQDLTSLQVTKINIQCMLISSLLIEFDGRDREEIKLIEKLLTNLPIAHQKQSHELIQVHYNDMKLFRKKNNMFILCQKALVANQLDKQYEVDEGGMDIGEKSGDNGNDDEVGKNIDDDPRCDDIADGGEIEVNSMSSEVLVKKKITQLIQLCEERRLPWQLLQTNHTKIPKKQDLIKLLIQPAQESIKVDTEQKRIEKAEEYDDDDDDLEISEIIKKKISVKTLRKWFNQFDKHGKFFARTQRKQISFLQEHELEEISFKQCTTKERGRKDQYIV